MNNKVIIRKGEPEGTVIESGSSKITLSLAGDDMLKKNRSFLESLPEGTENKEEAISLVNLYLNSGSLKRVQ